MSYLFTPELEEQILEGLMDGMSLREICLRDGFPNRSTVVRWQASMPEFAAKCARAREVQADLMDDKILETADACTPETAQADRVKIAAYQWRASKLKPKVYGDKIQQEHSGANGGPLVFEILTGVPRDGS